MTMFKTIFFFTFLILITSAMGQTEVSYARLGTTSSLEITWTADNYGTIQWQKSTNQGESWTNITNQTKPVLEFTASGDALYRAQITGQPDCEPLYITREVKTVSFDIELSTITEDSAFFQVSNLNLREAEIVEWGFSFNRSELYPRSYKDMQMVKSGENLPTGSSFEIACGNLLPGTSYSIRLYLKTADGSVIYGPGRIAVTLAGIKWTNENWIITKNSLSACFELAGFNSTMGNPDVQFRFGTSTDNLQSYTVSELGNYKYASETMASLEANTTYFIQALAMVDGDLQVITKQVKTLPDYSNVVVDNTPTSVQHTVKWDNTQTLHRISPEGLQTEYPRIIRVNADTLLCSYHGGTQGDYWVNIYLQKSYDNGRTWTEPTTLLDKEKSVMGQRYWRFCNPEMTKLKNGWILMPFIGNGNPETNDNCHVLIMVSKDKGETWSDPQIIGRGRTWEPMILQLPNDELELYVSSEAQWYGTGSNVYQEILYCRSTDNGETWTQLKRACYSPNRRDGMPVAINMQGNKGILFSVEIVNDGGWGSPTLVHRPLNGEWDETPWDGISDDDRWKVNMNAFGGGPYILQLPTGEIVTSAHVNGSAVWQTSYARIAVGDSDGKNFTTPVTPITNLPSTQGAYYNSLFLKDNETVWLVVTHSLYDGTTRKKGEIQYIEGKIIEKN